MERALCSRRKLPANRAGRGTKSTETPERASAVRRGGEPAAGQDEEGGENERTKEREARARLPGSGWTRAPTNVAVNGGRWEGR
jgi:hypothetical protein